MIDKSQHLRLKNTRTESERMMKEYGIDLAEDDVKQMDKKQWKQRLWE